MIKVSLIDMSDRDEPLNKIFDWEIISYQSTMMQIQLNFTEPINISSSNLDKVSIDFE